MARFKGTVQGGRGEASRLGSKKSGMKVGADGWNVGAELDASVFEDDRDVVRFTATSGSNNNHPAVPVADVFETADGLRIELDDNPHMLAAAKRLIARMEGIK